MVVLTTVYIHFKVDVININVTIVAVTNVTVVIMNVAIVIVTLTPIDHTRHTCDKDNI